MQRELNLRQRRWLELLKVYDMSVYSHPGKANILADSLSRFSMKSASHINDKKKELAKNVHRLERLGVRIVDAPDGGVPIHSSSKSLYVVDVKSKTHLHPVFMDLKYSVFVRLMNHSL